MTSSIQPAVLRPLPDQLDITARYIAQCQLPSGAIPWFPNGKLDPWDHTEAAMALSVAGYYQEAERAYAWLQQQQLPDGSWFAHYVFNDAGLLEAQPNDLRETNFIAYIATGVWHHFLISRDAEFLQRLFSCVEKAINFVVNYQTEFGDIAWAVDDDGNAQNDALITACSSILRSLDCANNIANTLKKPQPHWQLAASRLFNVLKNHPERFDRTWESKARFSMDWYYPILAGVYQGEAARNRLQNRWQEFVQPNLGCRCVSDEPWVTIAETSELIMALVACDELTLAEQLYRNLHQWRDSDGGYWTGYVFRDNAIWPEEKTTWTAGAVLLAADALYRLTPAHRLFCAPAEPCQ